MPRLPVRTLQTMTTAHDFSFAKLDQPGEIKLADYAGQVVLLVNVASACGFTSQYRDLEALYEAKVGKGFVIIGIPCNDFGHQEPGDAREIREFCDTSYHVTFPMTAKVEIVPPRAAIRSISGSRMNWARALCRAGTSTSISSAKTARLKAPTVRKRRRSPLICSKPSKRRSPPNARC